MDNNNRKRRQNDQSHHPSSDQRYGSDQSQGRGYATGSTDRYRAGAPMTTPPAAGRGAGVASSGFGYYSDSASAFSTALPSTLHYPPEYGTDQRQPPSFASYSPSMMYNVNQQGAQNTVYDTAQHFQQRQPAGMQLLPEAAGPYYAGEPGTGPAAPIMQHQQSSSSSTAFQPSPAADRNQLLQGYSGSMAGMGGIAQGPPEFIDHGQQVGDQASVEPSAALDSFLDALKEIFQNIRNGMLIEASSSLMEVSDWLLSHVTELGEPSFTTHINTEGLTVLNKGLHVDNANEYGDRFKMWEDFNTAWLALLQKQKDLTLDSIRSGAPPRQPQNLISHESLNKMAKELIRLCDNIEKYGLVDYQYGVWEERIVTVLMECVDLLEDNEPGRSTGAGSLPRASQNPGMGRPPP